MPNKFTEKVQQTFEKALQYAQKHLHTEVSENHLLYYFFEKPEDLFSSIGVSLKLDPQIIRTQVKSILDKTPVFAKTGTEPLFSLNLQKLLKIAQEIADKWSDSYISSEHFFMPSGN